MPTIPQVVRGARIAVKVAGTVASVAPVAAPVLKQGTGKFTTARREREAKRAEKKREKLEAKTRAAIESADKELDATRVEELWAQFGARGRLEALGYIGGPGCYAILTLTGDPHAADGSDLRGWFVGSAQVMGRGVHGELTGEGNKDVYADYKYGQPMSVLFFPCVPEDFGKIERVLRGSFDPAKAYE